MKCTVVYCSRRGHTRKVAEAIAEVCNVEATSITESHSLEDVDLLFVGMNIKDGKPDDLMLHYLDQLPVKKIRAAVVFSTCSSNEDHMALAVSLLKHKGITVCKEHFVCEGSHWLKAYGHPNVDDLNQAKEFAHRVLNAFEQLVQGKGH